VVRDDGTPEDDDDSASESPVTLEQLADLQAGLLDDAAAARLRRQIRDDPELARRFAALQQIRRDLKDLAGAPAPEPPADVTAQIRAALRGGPARPTPTHAVGHRVRWRRPAALVGAAAVALAVVLAVTLLRDDSDRPTDRTGPTAAMLTPPRHSGMPMADHKILALLARRTDLGPLADPSRLASCLQGLGYSTGTPVLGATVLGDDRVLLVLPESDPRSVMALLVRNTCRAGDAGLLADAMLTRP